jgi:serine/alanine adding enzyme
MSLIPSRPHATLREVPPDQWDALLEERGLRDIYFLRAYVEATCSIEKGRPAYLHAAGDDGDVVFACIVRDNPPDVTTPYGGGGPLALGPRPPVEHFWALYETWCRDRGIVASFFRFHPLLGNHRGVPVHVERLGRTVAWRLAPRIDLAETMHKHHRRLARKAEREGLKAHVEAAPASLDEFIAIYERTMRRNAASDFYLFPAVYWQTLIGTLRDRLVRVDVRRGAEVHASALVFATRPWLHYHLAGSSDDGRALGASHLALLATARWGQDRGYERLHLGGGVGGREDSLFEFKSRFDPHGLLEYAVGKAVHDRARYHQLSGVDPSVLEGFFPAYRHPARSQQLASAGVPATSPPGSNDEHTSESARHQGE